MEFGTITEKQTRTLTMKEGSGDCFEKTVKAERCGKRGVEVRQKDSGFDKKSLQNSEKQRE